MPGDHGILNPRAGEARFTLARYPPSPALAAFVDRYWIVRWDLDAPFAQETLPHPCVNLVLGDHQPGVHGPAIPRFVAQLTGAGSVLGVKFLPGGFRPFLGRDVHELAGRSISVRAMFGDDAAALEACDPAASDAARVAHADAFLAARAPAPDPSIDLVSRAVAAAQAEPRLARTAELAGRVDVSPRTLERLFRSYVGVSPKWVIRRYRIHEACERAKTGVAPAWADLAHELGYFDQSHFIRDFKAQVGRTPADYAALCAGVIAPAASPSSSP